MSELVAQGYSQLLEEADETNNEVSSDTVHGSLCEQGTHASLPISAEPASSSTVKENKDICVTEYQDKPKDSISEKVVSSLANDSQNGTNKHTQHNQPDQSGKEWIHPFDREIEHPFQMSSIQLDDPSLDIADNDIISIAPSEGERPVNQIQSEGLCFPKEFPLGSNTFLTRTESGEFRQNRELEISLTKYFDARILSMDNRFVSNPEYVFYAQYLKERQQIRDAAKIALKKGPSCTADGSQLTAEMLVDNNKFRKNIVKNSLGYKSFSDNRATPPYREKTMNGLFAAFKQIGPATFFLSFSAADRRWPEIAKAILIQQNKDPSLSDNLDWSEYCQLINSNPLTAVLMFERRVSQFLKLMTSKAEPLGGEVTDIFLRRENQVNYISHCAFTLHL